MFSWDLHYGLNCPTFDVKWKSSLNNFISDKFCSMDRKMFSNTNDLSEITPASIFVYFEHTTILVII